MNIVKYSIGKSVIAWVVTIILLGLLGARFVSLAGSATSAREVVGHGNAEKAGLPTPTAEPEEHGLSKKAVEIARPFGFPITNSMVVSWIVAVGVDHFCLRVRHRSARHHGLEVAILDLVS